MPSNVELSSSERGLIDALVASMASGRRVAELQLANAWRAQAEPGSDEDWLTIGTPADAPRLPEKVMDPVLSVYRGGERDGYLTLLRDGNRFVSLEWIDRSTEKSPGVPSAFPSLDQLVDDAYPPPLVRAAFENDTETLLSLLNKGVPVQQAQPGGYTALHAALVCENAEAVSVLMDAGADINALDDAGLSPLSRILFRFHNGNIMRDLARRGVDFLDPRHGGPSVLPNAVAYEQLDRVQTLIELGCDPDGARQDGRTGLVLALENKNVSMIRLLIAAGADIHRPTPAGPHGEMTTPWQLAIEIAEPTVTQSLSGALN